MALSIFENKIPVPNTFDVREVLDNNFTIWQQLTDYVYQQYPDALEKWSYSGKSYGWGYSLRDKKRAIIYLTPARGFLYVGMVFGEKATKQAMNSDLSNEITDIIKSARVYAEGRGFRIKMECPEFLEDIKKLIDIKLAN